MTSTRDRLVAAVALVMLALLAGTVVFLVLDAQRAGIKTRENLRLEQVQQQAKALDTRVQQAYSTFVSIAGTPGTFTMRPDDPADRGKLEPLGPKPTSGPLLVAIDGTLLNGGLLRDRSLIGTKYTRPGLEQTFHGEPSITAVGPGLTTASPVIGIALPVRDSAGTIVGAYVYESEVSANSAFQQEIASLRTGRTAVFSFLDSNGNVIASTDETTIAHPSGLSTKARAAGFHRARWKVMAAADIPSARWSLVFQQSASEFEGDLTRPIRAAVILVALLVVVGGAFSVISLLRRLRAANEEQQRLAEISQAREEFASIVSHELRTPVAGLLGFLETTIDHWDDMADGDRRQAVSRAAQNAQRLRQLTGDVLDTSAMESGQVQYRFEPGDLRAVVTDAVDVTLAANPDRTISVDAPDGEVIVDVDATRLRQVIGNLLDNAVKSSPAEAPVDVAVRRVDGQARVEVRDRGSGIAPADRERVFEKFTRAGVGLTRGTGLGLYLAREIVHAHGGNIWVADSDGPGTTVVLTLPLGSDA